MRLFQKAPDGGKQSGVTGYFLIEIKNFFSVVLLKFETGSRETLHSHAFNAWTWWLKGMVREWYSNGTYKYWTPSLKPKKTPRSLFHRIEPFETSWALTFRGPWSKTWQEMDPKTNEKVTLTNGRKVLTRSV